MKKGLFLLLLLFQLALHAQEEPATEPEPTNLRTGWWEYFDVSGEDLKERIKTFEADLRSLTKDLSLENQEPAESSIQQFSASLTNYANIREQSPAKPTTPRPYLKSYSIESLLELQGQVRKQRIELKSIEEELKKERSEESESQARFDKLMIQYNDLEDRSEEKLLTGLKVLAERSDLEVTKRTIEILLQKVSNLTDTVKHNSDEIEHAIEFLNSSPEEEDQFSQEITTTKAAWDEAVQKRKAVQAVRSEELSSETEEKSGIKNEFLTLQVVAARIEENNAHINYIQAEMIFQLSRLLNSPQEISLSEILAYLEKWEGLAREFQQQADSWEELTRRSMQQAVELLSLKNETVVDKAILDKIISTGQQNILQLQKLRSKISDTLFLGRVIDQKVVQLKGIGERWYREALNFFIGIFYALTAFGGQTLFTVGQSPVTLFNVFQFIFIMILTFWGARVIVNTLLTVTHKRKGIKRGVVYRLSRLIYYSTLLLGLTIGLTFLGFNLTNIFLIAGALGVGLGFGLQNIFNNFISGIIILFQSNLRIGDFVELEPGVVGEIREINVTTTMITTNDGVDILMPNSEMISNRVVNWTLKDPHRREHVPFAVAYGTDLDKVVEIVVETAKKVPGTLQKPGVPEPVVYMRGFGDSSLDFELVVWVDEKLTRKKRNTQSRYLFAIEKAFKEHQIKVPFPQRDVHVIKPEE